MYQKADALLCIAELEILADGLHLILIDPYNEPKLKVRYPHSATYEEVRHALEDVCVCMCMYSYAVCAHSFSVAYAQTWLRLILKAASSLHSCTAGMSFAMTAGVCVMAERMNVPPESMLQLKLNDQNILRIEA